MVGGIDLVVEFLRAADIFRFAKQCRFDIGKVNRCSLRRQHYPVVVTEMPDAYTVEFENADVRVETDWRIDETLFDGKIDGVPVTVQVERMGTEWRLIHSGIDLRVMVLSARAAELWSHIPVKEAADLSKFLLSPMPGLLVSVAVTDGEEGKAGQTRAVVEAMKLENVLRAEKDGTVSKIKASPGDSLAVDQVIIEFA